MTVPSPTTRLFRHSASYLVGQILFFLSRLVFYCAFTRLFAPAGYGTLNLIASGILFVVVAARLGQEDAIVRFLPEWGRRGRAGTFVASVFVPMLVVGACVVGLLIVVVMVASARWEMTRDLRWALYFAAMIVCLRLGFDLTYAVLRGEGRAGQAAALSAARHWAALAGSLALVALWHVSMAPFFAGQLCGELLIFAACLLFLERRYAVHRRRLDRPMRREALRYGLPMALFHLAAVALLYADRYLVLAFFDAQAVGQYAAGYNLAMMVQQFVAVPVALAVVPLYTGLWSQGDREGARAFIQTALRWFWVGVWPCVFGVVAIQSNLVRCLATEKYLESSQVIGYILLGYVIYGGYPMYAAGLLLHKKTATMSAWMAVALGVNIAGNLLLIPRFYILGAAAATGVSYLVLAAGLARAGHRHLRLRFWPRPATISLAAALAMFLAIWKISLPSPWATLGVQVAAGAVIYAILVAAADQEIRAWVLSKGRR